MNLSQNVYQFKDRKVQSSPPFIKKIEEPTSGWMQTSFQQTSQQVENFYKKFFPKKTPLTPPQQANFFKYDVSENQNLQINFNEPTHENECVHNFIELKEGACLYLFENESLPWLFYHIYLSPRSQVFRFKRTQKPHRCFVFSTLQESSCFFNFEINTHSKESYVLMEGRGKESIGISRSLNLLSDRQTVLEQVEHQQKAEKSYTRQIFKSVVSGKALARIHSMAVLKAQETDSHQLLQGLLLDEGACENRPELKVFKDQVQATHGSTVGTVNPLEVFYLNSRGISKNQALKILIQAWVSQIFEIQDLKDKIKNDFIHRVQNSSQSILETKLKSFL